MLTVSFWTALKAAVDGWLSNFVFSASPAAVVANAGVLAADWNVKVRDPLNQNTQTYTAGVLSTVSLGVATASGGTSVNTSGTHASDVVAKINARKCTTVYSAKVYTVCTSNPGCTCNGNCSCDNT